VAKAGEDDEDEEGPKLPVGTKNYMTPGGARRLQEELRQLLSIERPKVVEVVSWAASNGDRSENGDYIYGKRRLREIDRRVRYLTKRLDAVEVIDPAEQKGKVVRFGATVTVENEDGKKSTYAIVGMDETDAPRGRISWISPIGRALLKAKAGDVVTVRTPGGPEELEVLAVKFLPLA
jgi:transcription elongation factor GreB